MFMVRHLPPNALAQPQPPESQDLTKREGSDSLPTLETGRDGGCWLKRAG